jgi:hypothetical protein
LVNKAQRAQLAQQDLLVQQVQLEQLGQLGQLGPRAQRAQQGQPAHMRARCRLQLFHLLVTHSFLVMQENFFIRWSRQL